MNRITVVGNVGQDPQLRYSPSGKAIVKFSVADTTGKDDQKKTVWHDVVAFDEQAENVAAQVVKGSRVVVTGRLNKEPFEGKDGVKRVSVEVIADEVGVSLRWGQSSNTSRGQTAPEEPF
jgi:single-strand DNA-binding protein